MPAKPFKVTFYLDGQGVCFDPYEPIHLDGLVAYCLAPLHKSFDPNATEEPKEFDLPLSRWKIDGAWGWMASALFPEGGEQETLQYFRKRFREERSEIVAAKSVMVAAGLFKPYNTPIPLYLVRQMTAYAVGSRKETLKLLRKNVRGLGKERARGKGRVVRIEAEYVEEDLSMIQDGNAQRYLPAGDGQRLVRTRPPYWNLCGRVQCCSVGDEYAF